MSNPDRSNRSRIRSWVVFVATLCMVLLTARLGWWQLDRATQKNSLQRTWNERASLPALQLYELPATAEAAQSLHYRKVVLHGTWVTDATIYLDNRQMNGRPGFFVVTPLKLLAGSASDRVVLIQRGWIPRDFVDRNRLPELSTPSGEVAVEGHVAPPPGRLYEFGAGSGGRIRQNLDIPSLANETKLPLQPYSVVQVVSEQSKGDALLRHWPGPTVDVSKHHGYAFQWFSLSALLVGLYVWFQWLRPAIQSRRNQNSHEY